MEQDAALGDAAVGAELVQPDAALAAALAVVVAVVPVGLGTEVRYFQQRLPLPALNCMCLFFCLLIVVLAVM